MAGIMNPWPIVLAAGDGTRLNGLSRDRWGRPAPKQYSSLYGGKSMLSWALDRAGRLAPEERIVAVVAEQHEQWWADELAAYPEVNVVVQPRNRGTAPGVLLPLMQVAQVDPDATLVFLPSDHYVADEDVLQRALARAGRCVEATPQKLVLLGIEPEHPETEYGWILPGAPNASNARGTRGVAAFVEKPDEGRAAQLLAEGGLWNSFIFAGKVRTLLDLFAWSQPRLLWRFVADLAYGHGRFDDLERLDDRLAVVDFSRDVLQRAAPRLSVLRVAPCGWTDLGTPARVLSWRMRSASREQELDSAGDSILVPTGAA